MCEDGRRYSHHAQAGILKFNRVVKVFTGVHRVYALQEVIVSRT